MATIGKLAVEITADTKGLSSGLKSAGAETDAFGTRMDGLVSKLKVVGPLAIAAGAAFAVSMVKGVADTADALAKLSAKTGVTVEDLSRLQFAASLAGVSNDQLTAGITRLSRGMTEAASGTGEARKAFDAMGVSVKNSDGTLRKQNEVLGDLANRFASYKDGAEKSALAQQIFGRSGADLIPLLNGGAQGLKDMADESDRLGNTINTKTAKAAEEFNDNLTRLAALSNSAGRSLADDLLPSLVSVTGALIKGAEASKIYGKELGKAFDDALAKAAALSPFLRMLGMLREVQKAEAATAATTAIAETITPADARPSAPVIASQDNEKARQQAAKDAEAAKKAAQDVEDFFAKTQNTQRQREINNLSDFIEGLKIREDARLQSGLTEQQLAEEQFAIELEQLIASKEALALTEEAFNERLLQIRMDRDERIMNADLNMLDKEKQMADERVRINQQAEQLISNAREASTNAAIGLLSALGGKSKGAAMAAIALGKALSIAQIIQNTAVAQMRALAELGPLAGSAAAAKIGVMGKVQMGLVAATGLVQAAGISSGGAQSITAGNNIQSAANSSGSSAMQGGAMQGGMANNQTITVQGIGNDSLFSGDAVRTLIDRLIDAQRNGARIVLA